MSSDKKFYKWFYDHIHSHYYNLLMIWCFFPFGGEKKVRNELISVVDFKKNDKILDMCCGTGNTTFAIAGKTKDSVSISGIDLSDGQIKIARNNNRFPKVNFQVMDATKTKYLNGEFDKVIIPHALHEMKKDFRIRVLKEANRILKKAGSITVLEMDNPPRLSTRILIGFIWFYWFPFNFETPTRRDMLKHGLKEEVIEADFKNVSKINMFNGVFQIVQGIK
ncbi:class I SAM-dependent methyltransferase [candidate division KSB1 bacterium]|nr:class I SAM-dependent methyltransferase [candidate division KSB1 bacterium]